MISLLSVALLGSCLGGLTEGGCDPAHPAHVYLQLKPGVRIAASPTGYLVTGLRVRGSFPDRSHVGRGFCTGQQWPVNTSLVIALGGATIKSDYYPIQASDAGDRGPDDASCAAVWDLIASKVNDRLPDSVVVPQLPTAYVTRFFVDGQIVEQTADTPLPVDPTASGCAVSGPSSVDVTPGTATRDYALLCSAGGSAILSVVDSAGLPVSILRDHGGSVTVTSPVGAWPLPVVVSSGAPYRFPVKFEPDMDAPPGVYEFRGAIKVAFQ